MHLTKPPGISTRQRSHGFTLIEILTAITILALLAMLSVPMLGTFNMNTQIRNAGESMLNGVHLAQTEAVKRNGRVEWALTSTGWTVNDVTDTNAVTAVAEQPFSGGASHAVLDATGWVTFNGLGRIVGNRNNQPPLAQVNVTHDSGNTSARALRLVIGSLHGIKLCDPAVDDTFPAACPPAGQ